jgi:hypothetical protein
LQKSKAPPRSESPPTAANVPKPNVNRAVPRPEVVTATIAPKPNVNFGAAAPTRAPVTADTVPRPKSNAPPRSEADKAVSSASLNVAEVMSDTSLPKASANRDDSSSSQCVWAAVKLRDGVSDTKFPPARLLREFPEALSVECIFDDRGRCRSQCLVFPAAMKSKQLQSSVLGCWVKPLKQPMEPNAREGYNWVSYTREQLIARSGHEVAW